VKARSKFLIGGVVVLATAGYLMASSIKDTGVYYLTPSELAAKIQADSTFYRTGVKVGARVVPGSIRRAPGGRETSFRMTDGAKTYSVVYTGITPDTFTDSVDVVVEGRLGPDQTFRATTLLAKCASRYENTPDRPGQHQQAVQQYQQHADASVPPASAPAMTPPANAMASATRSAPLSLASRPTAPQHY
jgi:cytochrome c-type biogenesis protein CcmE